MKHTILVEWLDPDTGAWLPVLSPRKVTVRDAKMRCNGFRSVLVAFLLVAAAPSVAWTQQATDARVVLTVDKPSFFLGENVLLHFCVENVSSMPFAVSVGGDYRGGPRSARFKVTLADEQGRTVADPYPQPYNEGGLDISPTVAPGGRFCQSLPLSRYARVEQAGIYLVRATHDLAWPAGQAPEGQLRVTFQMPTAAQAEAVVSAMESLPRDEGQVMGTLSKPFRDFTALRYSVYLPALTQRARSGSTEALAGIGAIATPEATQTLIDLLGHADAGIARTAQQQLAMRLPDPALSGALPPRSPFGDDLADPRRYLRDASWRDGMAPAVRAAARKLLASSDPQDMIQGAFMIGTVGTVADGTDLAAALGRAIELTPTLPFEQQGYPRPRGAVQELLRAADVLVTRGFASPDRNTTGSIAMWLVGIGHGARPAGWVEDMLPLLSHRIMFVRELALDRMPAEVPASLVNAVGANLDPSVDLDVRIAACRVVDRGRLTALRAGVVRTLQTADEFWLRNAAGNALHALGAVYESLVIQASRIAEPALSAEILGSLLLGVLDATGLSSGPVAPEEARALAERWRVFVAAHRGNIEAHRKIPLDDPSVSADLVPRGWTLHRENKPGWPPR